MAGTSNQPGLCTEPSIERNVAHLLYNLTEKIVGNILLVVRHLSPAPSRGELENKELN